jgi:hypothetical protein
MRRPVRITAHHEADHLATHVTTPPPAFQGAVGAAQGVDHCRHLGMGFAEQVEHALCGQVAPDLFPHNVAQIFLGDVGSDAQRHREVHQMEFVGDDQHAVDGDLDAYHVVEMRWRTGHICPVCIRARKTTVIAASM